MQNFDYFEAQMQHRRVPCSAHIQKTMTIQIHSIAINEDDSYFQHEFSHILHNTMNFLHLIPICLPRFIASYLFQDQQSSTGDCILHSFAAASLGSDPHLGVAQT